MPQVFPRNHLLGVILILGLAGSAIAADETGSTGVQTKPAFVFQDVPYFHRWSQNEQHEFTPVKQEDLEKWSDMITLNGYPDAHDGDALATKANAVLENYKSHQATVLKTNSVPRTAEQPAEHLIAVLFTRPKFIEVAFARFRLADGQGSPAFILTGSMARKSVMRRARGYVQTVRRLRKP